MKHTKSRLIGFIVLVFAIGLVIDILFRNFQIITLGIAFAFLFIGRRQRRHGRSFSGNACLLIGLLLVGVIILTSIAFQLVVIASLLYYGYYLYKSPKKKVEVTLTESKGDAQSFVQTEPYFSNMLVGEMRNIGEMYELEDINIQYGFGDVQIDLSNTMIPEGETVVLIRGVVGSVHLYVPYDIDLSIQTSSFIGKTNLMNNSKTMFNRTQKYQTENYRTATRKIKIITSLIVGDVEVRNL